MQHSKNTRVEQKSQIHGTLMVQKTDKTQAHSNPNQWVILMCLFTKEYIFYWSTGEI